MSASETGCERDCRGKAAAVLMHTLLCAGLCTVFVPVCLAEYEHFWYS